MPAYNFKKNCKVYIVRGVSRYQLDVYPDLSFSQTFDEKEQNVKTLHDQSAMFSDAVVNKANPANFNFTVMLGKGQDFRVLADWTTLNLMYDIYIDTGPKIFKITGSVIERATFNITALATVSISGSAIKLQEVSSLPVTVSVTRAYDQTIINSLQVMFGTQELKGISSLSFEYVNNIEWLEYDTIHKSLYVTNVSDTQYPETFVVSGRVLSGTIQQYLTEEALPSGWTTDTQVRISIGDYFGINLVSAVTTINTAPEDAFLQTITFRLNSNAVVPIEKALNEGILLDFSGNSYTQESELTDIGGLFLYTYPFANIVLDFVRNTYDIR